MVADDNRPPIPELARRITVGNSSHDPAAALVFAVAQDVHDGDAEDGRGRA